MANYKHPWIPKEYYSAVMFACKMIRENGYFNKAISCSANYYDVDYKTLEKHVRARQNAGKKGHKRGKFKYYTIYQLIETCEGSQRCCEKGLVIKALSKNNALKNKKFVSYLDGETYYARDFFPICGGEYATKEEAESRLFNDCDNLEY